MDIIMVAGHACVRVQKMAIPLLENGHKVHLIANKTPSYWDQYDSFTKVPTVRQYIEAIKAHASTADIFHCHNEPSWFVTAIKEITDKPVILDVHDSYLARITDDEYIALKDKGENALRISVEERNNFQLADGLIFCSKPFGDIVLNEFGLDQPSMVLPSYVPDFLYQYQGVKKEWLGGLVYEGRVDLPEQTNGENHGFRYCNYLELAKQAKEIGMDLHLYPGRNLEEDQKFFDIYKEFAILHNARSFLDILHSITRHDWGLIGNLFHTPDWEVALPNKFFEYIAASVPVVAMNAAHVEEWIKEYGLGIVVKDLHELAERWGEHREVRRSLVRVRNQFTMQNHIHILEEFYRQFI